MGAHMIRAPDISTLKKSLIQSTFLPFLSRLNIMAANCFRRIWKAANVEGA